VPRYPFPRGKTVALLVVPVVKAVSLDVVALLGFLVIWIDLDSLKQPVPFDLVFVLVNDHVNSVVVRFGTVALSGGHVLFILAFGHDVLLGDFLTC
jgi:hypothetical protein